MKKFKEWSFDLLFRFSFIVLIVIDFGSDFIAHYAETKASDVVLELIKLVIICFLWISLNKKIKERDATIENNKLSLQKRQGADVNWLSIFLLISLLLMLTLSTVGNIFLKDKYSAIEYYQIGGSLIKFFIAIIVFWVGTANRNYRIQQGKVIRNTFGKNIDNKIGLLKRKRIFLENKYKKDKDKESIIINYLELIENIDIPLMIMENGLSSSNGKKSREFLEVTSKIDELQKEYDRILKRVDELNGVVIDGSKKKQAERKCRKAISRKQGNNSFKRHSR